MATIFTNESVFKDVLRDCQRDPELEREAICWETVALHARNEIEALFPDDVKLTAETDSLPEPRTELVKALDDAQRPFRRAILKTVRLYCRLRLSRERDSSLLTP